MNMQPYLAFVLLISLVIVPGPSAAVSEVEEPVPSPAEGPALSAAVPTDWWATAQEDIRQSEYHVTWQEHTYLPNVPAAYQAPNRAHNLRTYFTAEGPVIIPRTPTQPSPYQGEGQGGGWCWGLALTAWGQEGAMQPAAAATLHPDGNRIEYRRGSITEWYVNDERGLEQGFTIATPPVGAGLAPAQAGGQPQGLPLRIDLSLSGDLIPNVTDDHRAIEFTTPHGTRVLRYGDLHATDATDRQLAVHFSIGNPHSAIRIVVDPTSALYPLTLVATLTGLSPTAPTGLSTSPDWTAESDQADAWLGYSAGTAGDVNGDGYADVIVGAPRYDNGQEDEGRAFVYHGSATGLSTTSNWTAESDQVGARFGWSLGTAGDVNGDGFTDVIVGAYLYEDGETDEGRAYVYHGSEVGLIAIADWTAEGDQTNARFGYSVGTAGDVNGDGYVDVIVGAVWYSNGQSAEGRAFIYHGSNAGLSTTAAWMAESDQADAYFSTSVGTAGDVNGDGYADVIVGAGLYDNGETDEGRAYAYHGSTAGLSTRADWTVESDWAFADFGHSVGTAGDVNGDGYADVIVGASGYSNGEHKEGRTYVYHGAAEGLSTTANWTAESNSVDAAFGYSVRTAGDVNGDGYADVIVGASKYGEANAGRAYVYHGSAVGLNATADWTAESDRGYADFGHSVGTAGDVNGDGYTDVIVGAYSDSHGEADEGTAFVYHGSADGLSATAGWTAASDQNQANFGYSVDTAGDVNGDGYADVIVGAWIYDNGETNEGQAYVFHGSATGLESTAAWTADGDQAEARFGFSVSRAGDVNGDGYADIIVGAPWYDNPEDIEGRVFVYHGSAAGLSDSAAWTAESDQAGAHFGWSIGEAGDVNGDGYADVIIGARFYDNGEANEGQAFVYHGAATGLSMMANWTAESNQADAGFGVSVGTAGDVNGDGYSDVIVGAFVYDNPESSEGRAYVYHGSAMGLNATANWTAESNQAGGHFGYSVSTAGDVNGDGYADVIVGADKFDNGQDDEGRAYVYHGSAAGLDTDPNWTTENDQPMATFGSSVGTAGDVNGDGYADVIVGAPYSGGPVGGPVYVYHGSASGLSPSASWTAETSQQGDYFGWAVGTSGDVNGDGYTDVVVGACARFNGLGGEGRVFVYYGNGGAGLSLNPRQRRSDDNAPIAPLGASDSHSAFRLALLGRTPFGRSQVKLEWEVKPLGVLFDGTGTQQSAAWMDTGTAGAELNELVSNLSADTAYHWRVRLRYHPASIPFQQYSRWLTMPWNGWNEQDLRTAAEPPPTDTPTPTNTPTDTPTVTPSPTQTPTPTDTPTPTPTATPSTRLGYLPLVMKRWPLPTPTPTPTNTPTRPPTPTATPTSCFQGPWEREPNNNSGEANGPLCSGRDYFGYPNDQRDYFSIHLLSTGQITITLENHTGQGGQLQLFYKDTGHRVGYDPDPPYEITYWGEPGWYYIYIYTESGYNSTTPYTLRATFPE